MAAAPAGHTFIQVRLSARNLVLGTATASGGRAEALVESVVREPQEAAFRVWALVRGFTAAEIQRIAEAIQQRYLVQPRVATEGPDAYRILYDVNPHQLQDRFWGALLAFETSFGPPWLLFKGGHVTLRAQGVDCEPPECAARLHHTLDLADVRAHVEIVEVPDGELADVRRLDAWRTAAGGEDIEPRHRARGARPRRGGTRHARPRESPDLRK